MRALLLALPLSILTLFPSSGDAGDARPRQIAAVSDSEKVQLTNPNHETYIGYYLDLSQIAARQDFAVMANALRHQLDNVESVRLSQRVLNFFHSVPIVVDEVACLNTEKADGKASNDDKAPNHALACYGPVNLPERTSREPTVLDSGKWNNPDPVALAEDTNRGVVFVRPIMLDASSKNAQRPVILHEMFHSYHAIIMPQGVKNPSILFYYDQAKSKQLYPADAYLMTNVKEFFAVTASVFLSGDDGKFTRSNLKEKQPDYYNYLRWLLEIDPDRAPSGSPVASAD
jgi:hypothetical protein